MIASLNSAYFQLGQDKIEAIAKILNCRISKFLIYTLLICRENQQKQAEATNYIEIDNVRFETWMPKREITIPLIKQQTPLELGIRITTNTLNNFYFCFFSSLSPKLIAPDGQVLQLGACTDGIRFADKYDFMQFMRWQAVTFCFESVLSWSIYRKKIEKKARLPPHIWY